MPALTILLKYKQKCYKFLRQIMKTCQSHFVFFFFIFLFFTHKTCICEYCLNGIYNGLYMISYICTDERTVSPPLTLYILTIDSLDICWDTMNVLTDFLCAFCFHFYFRGKTIFVCSVADYTQPVH